MPTGLGATSDAVTDALPSRSLKTELPAVWPESLAIYRDVLDPFWPIGLRADKRLKAKLSGERDLASFFGTAAGFYLAILGVSLFWWGRSAFRRRRLARLRRSAEGSLLVSRSVMEKAEERWAKRVLGASAAPNADRTRFSNGAVEQNFHMQLRAI